jgi:hypothetical protein
MSIREAKEENMAMNTQVFARKRLRVVPLLRSYVVPSIIMTLAFANIWVASAASQAKAYITNEKSTFHRI